MLKRINIILATMFLISISPSQLMCQKSNENNVFYNYKLDYIKSVRYSKFVVEDDFKNNKYRILRKNSSSTTPFYSNLVGGLSLENMDYKNGILNLCSKDAIPVPWGTDFDVDIQQEFSVPSEIQEKNDQNAWNGNYQLIARFVGDTVDELIPKDMNGITSYYDVAIARNNPFTAANGAMTAKGIIFTKVFHDPKTDRDKVEEIVQINWKKVALNPKDPTLTLRIDLNDNGMVTAYYSNDREKTWKEICKTSLPDSNFQRRIITGAHGNYRTK